MSKDSQIDPKEVRKAKAKGGPRIGQSEHDNESNNAKKQSAKRNDV